MNGLELGMGLREIGLAALAAFLLSLLTCVALVVTRGWHGHVSNDAVHGIQKFHKVPTPRIGGVGIALAYGLVWPVLPEPLQPIWAAIGIAAIPCFAAGIGEDLTRKVGVKWRLLATMGVGRHLRTADRLHHAQGLPAGGGLAALLHRLRAPLHRLRDGGGRQRRQHHRRLQRPCVGLAPHHARGLRLRRRPGRGRARLRARDPLRRARPGVSSW